MTPATNVLASNLAFPEGPSLLPDGSIVVAEMQGGSLAVVSADGSVERFDGLGGGPNGTAVDAAGAVLVANNGGLSVTSAGGYWHSEDFGDGRVQRVTADECSRVAESLPGPAPHRPNDLAFGPDGRLYVTDSGNWEDMANLRDGTVLALDADGSVSVVAEVPALPNGIAFSPDGERMYIAQTMTRKILVYPWSNGQVGEPTELCKLPSGAPDGIALSSDGRLFVCGSYGNVIHVLAPDGQILESWDTPAGSQPTNCCLAEGRLLVTFGVSGELVAFETDAQPTPLFTASFGSNALRDR